MVVTRAEHTREATFDLTPMIDVVLLLIIFFTLTSQFSKSTRKAMDLPREKGVAAVEKPPLAIVLEVDRDGGVKIDGAEHDERSLAQLVAREATKAPGGTAGIDIIVRADRNCKAGKLNAIAATLRAVGIQRWKLATSPDS